MATKLTKPVTRETEVIVRTHKGSRNLIVTLQGDCISLKPKGLRDVEILTLKEAFEIAQINRVRGNKK
tara:strand:- start:323 stop:526 length:204 start_codon:yes stop_codon:yes gene_type:complete